jgi:tetratricopeptide (TPR) repeat protein
LSWNGEVEHYKKKIEQDPENPWLYRDLARTMFKNGEYGETIEYVGKASMLDPHYCGDFFYSGISKIQLSAEEEAIQDLDEAIGLYPEYGAAYFYRGRAKQLLYRYEEAIADYDKAIELMPKEPGLYYNRGLAESELGQYPKAIASFERAIELGFENRELVLDEIDVAESKLEGGCGCSAVGSSSINTVADQSLLSLLMTVLFD